MTAHDWILDPQDPLTGIFRRYRCTICKGQFVVHANKRPDPWALVDGLLTCDEIIVRNIMGN